MLLALAFLMLTSMANPFAKVLCLLKPRRRWAQFSLGTMLVLVAALCAVLAMIVVPAEEQRRVVAAIEAVDGSIVYRDYAESFPTSALRCWLPADYLNEVQHIDLGSSRPSDAALTQPLWRMRLKQLSLHSPQVGPSWFDHHNVPDGMGGVAPRETRGVGPALAHLDALNGLESLRLDGRDVTDAEVECFQGLTHLRLLGLNNTQTTDAGLAHLEGLRSLEMLGLQRTQITDAGLPHLAGLKDLEWLYLDFTHVTGEGLAHVKLPGLRSLGLNYTHVTDAGLAHLDGMKGLTSLGLAGTQVTDAGLAHLEGLAELRQLDISWTPITDAGLMQLGRLKRLETLSIIGLQGPWARVQRDAQQQGFSLDSPKITDAGLAYQVHGP